MSPTKRMLDTKMVPVPSEGIVPERDLGSSPYWRPAIWALSSAA